MLLCKKKRERDGHPTNIASVNLVMGCCSKVGFFFLTIITPALAIPMLVGRAKTSGVLADVGVAPLVPVLVGVGRQLRRGGRGDFPPRGVGGLRPHSPRSP